MEKKKKQTFTLRIEEGLIKKVKIQAIKENKNVNEIIEKLLVEYLKKGDKHHDNRTEKSKDQM